MRNNLDLLGERDDQVRLYCYSVFVWSALFGVLQDKVTVPGAQRRDVTDVNNRLISIVHGQCTLWFCLVIHLTEHPTYTQKNTYSMIFIMIVSGAYFTYDLFVCLYYDLYDFWLVMHHMASILAYMASIMSQYTGTIAITALIYAEIPNLPMHLRRIIKDCGYRHTKIYESIELIYFFCFVVCRGALTPPLLIICWKDINSSLIIKLFGSVLMLQAAYYIYEMKQILRRKWIQHLERKKKKIYYHWFAINPSIEMLAYPKYERKDPIL